MNQPRARAITGSFYFTQNCAGAIAGERNPYERKSYQSNFYSNLRTDQLHSWSIDSTGSFDGGMQCP